MSIVYHTIVDCILLSMANHYESYQEIYSKIWTITLTLNQKALPNFDRPKILTQDKKKILKTFDKNPT